MCDSTRGRLSQTAAASRSLMAPLPTHSDHQRAIPTSGPLGSLCEWLLREGRVKVTLVGEREKRGDSPLLLVRADGEAPAVEREGDEITVQVRHNRCVLPTSRKLKTSTSVISWRAMRATPRQAVIPDQWDHWFSGIFVLSLFRGGWGNLLEMNKKKT